MDDVLHEGEDIIVSPYGANCVTVNLNTAFARWAI